MPDYYGILTLDDHLWALSRKIFNWKKIIMLNFIQKIIHSYKHDE